MIIGLSGYSGTGKDTVGLIIQQATAQERYGYLENTWEIKKWAGKLKTIASMLTGIPEFKFEDQAFKKTYLPEQWNYWTISVIANDQLLFQKHRFNTKAEAEEYVEFMKQSYGNLDMQYVVGMQQMTVRQFLQELGTDALRDNFHPNTWVNALMSDYPSENNWVITDTRFPNEAEAIKKAGGIIIRIERPGVKPVNPHPSETSLDNWDFDYKIMNISDIDALAFTVKTILRKEKLLR